MGRSGPGYEIRGDSIRITFQFRGVRCRETIHLKPSPSNIKYALGLKAEIDRKVTLGTFVYSDYFPDSKNAERFSCGQENETVEKRLGAWLENRKRDLAESTWSSYETAVRCYLIQCLGTIKLRDLTTEHVRSMIGTMVISNKRINNVLIPLRGMIGDIFADGVIERNPMDRIKNLPVRSREPNPFNANEQAAIIEAAGENANIIQFGFWTGLRIGELIALRWSDIDWVHKRVHVRRNNVRQQKKGTKTAASDRSIELLWPALDALERQKELPYSEVGHVFLNPGTGLPWQDDIQFRSRAWTPTLRRSKVLYREPKQMRHTYASMMLTAGENIAWVSRQMGHKDIQTTLRKYARWIPQEGLGSGSKAVTMFAGNVPSMPQKQDGSL